MGISSPGAFNQVAKQQWNFPSYVGTLYLHLGVTSVSKLAGCGQPKTSSSWFGLVQHAWHDKE